jgi:hypothetical protein
MSKALAWIAMAWIASGVVAASSTASALATSPADHQQTIIAVAQGKLAGRTDAHGIRSFKGIPYAEPPVGPRRWKAPVPARSCNSLRRKLPGAPMAGGQHICRSSTPLQRRLPVAECVGCVVCKACGGHSLYLRWLAHPGQQLGADVRRSSLRRARSRVRVDQLPAWAARLAGSARAERGVTPRSFRQLWPVGSD